MAKKTRLKADELIASYYMILFESESDKGEEILVESLAIRCAKYNAKQCLSASSDKEFWNKVIMYLDKK